MAPRTALLGACAVGLALLLSACVPSTEVADIEVDATEVQGTTVRIAPAQTAYIDTSGLDADIESYTAEIDDESVVEFVPGLNAGDFGTYPGFTALRPGSTEVTLTGGDPGVPPLEFTIEVTDDR